MSDGPFILGMVASGDPDAVRACMDRYSGLVWSLARRFCFNPSDAEDAVQEIFLDLWKSAARYDSGVASEATFVAMIARRRLIDRRRRASRMGRMASVEINTIRVQPEKGDGRLEQREEALKAAEAIEKLRPEQQRVLRLSVYQGLSHERIAEATGLPLGTVKTHVRRGLIRVRELIGHTNAGMSDADTVESAMS